MNILDQNDSTGRGLWEKPWAILPLLFLLLFCGLSIFSMVGLAVIAWMTGIELKAAQDLILHPELYPNSRIALYVFQAISTPIGAMILPSWLYLKYFDRTSLEHRIGFEKFNSLALLLTLILVIAFMPFDSVIIEWNKNLDLGSLTAYATEMEKSAEKTTMFLTDFSGIGELAIGIFVIGILTAYGEELFFRGLVQNKLNDITKNKHLAIWATGFLFSFIHLQFFGFVPRMLLGVIFGYLYFWSGSFWVTFIAHFTNNTFTVIMLYLSKKHIIDIDIENTSAMPLWAVLFSAFITGGIMYLIYSQSKNQDSKISHETTNQ